MRLDHYNKFHNPIVIQNPNLLKCNHCRKSYKSKKSLERHLKNVHNITTEKRHERVVKVDNNSVSYRGVLFFKVNENKNLFKCSKCDRVVNRKELKRHIKNTHFGSLKCAQCKKYFKSQRFLAIHKETVHKLCSTTHCPICAMPFYGQTPKKRHIWTHYSENDRQEAIARGEKVPSFLERRFPCEKCNSRFRCNAELSIHFKRVHGEGGKELVKKLCGVCGALVTHLRHHTLQCHPTEEDFKHKCSLCDKKFVTHFLLQQHKLRHVEGKPFKCEFCGVDFKGETKYKAHRNRHHGIKPHQCHLCPFATTNSFVLKWHIQRLHEGKFPGIEVQNVQGGL